MNKNNNTKNFNIAKVAKVLGITKVGTMFYMAFITVCFTFLIISQFHSSEASDKVEKKYTPGVVELSKSSIEAYFKKTPDDTLNKKAAKLLSDNEKKVKCEYVDEFSDYTEYTYVGTINTVESDLQKAIKKQCKVINEKINCDAEKIGISVEEKSTNAKTKEVTLRIAVSVSYKNK